MKTKLPDDGTKQADKRRTVKAWRDEAASLSISDIITAMREAGLIPPGKKPSTRDIERFAALKSAESAVLKSQMIARDLSALEQLGGLGTMIITTLSDPATKSTQKAVAMALAGSLMKMAPTLINGTYAKEGETENLYTLSDDELDNIADELGGKK